jgi:hypothetical protein
LIFLVFGEKFPLEDLGFSRSMLAPQQLSGIHDIIGIHFLFQMGKK